MSPTAGSALAKLWHGLLAYAVKFGVVGLIGLVIDVALFNLLRLGVFGEGHWAQSALGAKTISTSVAIVFNWLGNRYWTFRRHRRRNYVREFMEYLIVSLGGMLIALACLWVSHHWLGLTSIVADNVATNVVGLALGTAFRFLLYRYWVYGHHRADGLSNLDRVEEAQRAIFEEPDATTDAAPDAVGEVPAATPRPSQPSAGTTAGTPPRAS
ncbi:putative flippase GtrA [Agromyces ramosus]|jgi:putative flippase GtrA|uniref:Putative flippase GtrA n=1 Tax=Agromyces ramosus TaxID=33879 RepID=A0A4Q7MIB3_9MICO|nr:GtrA family protein [Agromyces ramosus]RZS67936.1 putative flippase GtrA [Agromyces ramosus]